MKVLLTGGAGFIGVRLARALLDRGVLTGVTGKEEIIELGFQKEANLEEIVRYYIDDYLEG